MSRIKPTTKEEAIELGSSAYFSGLACSKGHYSSRRVKDDKCYDCIIQKRRHDNKSGIFKRMRDLELCQEIDNLLNRELDYD